MWVSSLGLEVVVRRAAFFFFGSETFIHLVVHHLGLPNLPIRCSEAMLWCILA